MVRSHISYRTVANLSHRYYGVFDHDSGFFNVSVDGSAPQRLLRAENSAGLYQSMLWSNTSLGPGRHTITLTNVEDFRRLGLDFFGSVTDDVK